MAPPPVSTGSRMPAITSSHHNLQQQHHHQHLMRSTQEHNIQRPRSNKPPASKRSITPNSRANDDVGGDQESGRVRVAVRLRPRTAEDLLSDADFAGCVELQPELKRLKLRKNNWSSDSYKFDEVFPEHASQKRVHEIVAKPVVEGVLNGYNGTVMAYGQTGTGKTYTLGRLSKDDVSERGIMVRSLEDILASTSRISDSVDVSYLQLYMESLQDLLAPEKVNLTIGEDPKTGDVRVNGATIIRIRDLDHFTELLQIGEANRHAANTKLNTESSRSHAILMVTVRRSMQGSTEDNFVTQQQDQTDLHRTNVIPKIQKSKLLIVDLAGSERLDKSGSEGQVLEEAKFINLSLTSLGKCINALAENSPHIPTRDSKLTRLLRDSFGGSARTSLIVTVGPSARHHVETTSTIMFGQRAMKIVNMLKLKEEFDYESLCHKLWNQIDNLTAELERQERLRENEKLILEKQINDQHVCFCERENDLIKRFELLQMENRRLQSEMKEKRSELNDEKEHNDLLHKKISELQINLNYSEEQQQQYGSYQNVLADTTQLYEKKIAEFVERLEEESAHALLAEEQLVSLKKLSRDQQTLLQVGSQQHVAEHSSCQKTLAENTNMYENKIAELAKQLVNQQARYESIKEQLEMEKKDKHISLQEKWSHSMESVGKGPTADVSSMFLKKSNPLQERQSSQRITIAKICEEVGFDKILPLLASEDTDVQIHVVKVVANLAAEDTHQEKIVEEGGLDALLMLLRSSLNATVLRVASGAIANLAMNELIQGLIISKGGAELLANTASKTNDQQTLRMVAGAIANLCGNDKLLFMLREQGAIKTLLQMAKPANNEVVAQVARGIANFAKCESRAVVQGYTKGRSLLLEDGALSWLNDHRDNRTSPSIQRHIELAICHLAQNKDNAMDFISSGATKELKRISDESNREEIRSLARKALSQFFPQ